MISSLVGPGWHTAEYAAAQWGKAPRTVQAWCASGFLLTCGFRVMKADTGDHRRWWIKFPDESVDSPLPSLTSLSEAAAPLAIDTPIHSHVTL